METPDDPTGKKNTFHQQESLDSIPRISKEEQVVHEIFNINQDLKKVIFEAAGVENIDKAEKLYSKYLETIFPESEVKNILFHNTDETFEEFNRKFIGKNTPREFIEYYGNGFYFSYRKADWGKNKIMNVKINLTLEECDNDNYFDDIHAVVSDPKRIHILGSRFDIEEFKEYISKNNQ